MRSSPHSSTMKGVVSSASAAAFVGLQIPSLYGGKFSTCFWNIGVINGGSINIAFADATANYWAAVYTEPAGVTLQLKCEYPYARYTALESDNALAAPVDAVADYQINPDPARATRSELVSGAASSADRSRSRYAIPRRRPR